MIFFFLDSVVILVQQVKIEILGNSSVSLFPLLMATITIVLTPIVNGLKKKIIAGNYGKVIYDIILLD